MKIKSVIDISRKIYAGMTVWPGDKDVKVNKELSMENGYLCNVTSVSMSVHTGTHMDAPLHFVNEGKDIGSLDLTRFIGDVKVFELEVEEKITEDHLKGLPIEEGDILFLKTSNSKIPEDEKFFEDYVYIDVSAASYLVERQIKSIGVDYLSVDNYHSKGFEAHKILLENEVGIIEGLCLEKVKPGSYFFSCLPLNIPRADGSPARAVLVEFEA